MIYFLASLSLLSIFLALMTLKQTREEIEWNGEVNEETYLDDGKSGVRKIHLDREERTDSLEDLR